MWRGAIFLKDLERFKGFKEIVARFYLAWRDFSLRKYFLFKQKSVPETGVTNLGEQNAILTSRDG